ncbi:MAG: DNA-methyltransferase [Candidatus Entotheonellia bacterium]
MRYEIIEANCFQWLQERPPNSIHAVVTDPPFGLLEYTTKELTKLRKGKGGVWRIPPEIGGCKRKPLPRFTVLSKEELAKLRQFFQQWGELLVNVLVPGGHIFIASNPLLSPHLAVALMNAGLERRGEIIRLVRTLRGGDRPKLSEKEFSDISVMPRSCYEPWGLYRKPLTESRVSLNLKKWGAGGLRRTPHDRPFPDVLKSETAPDHEVQIAPHPSLKPQRFLRQIVWAALPLGCGTIVDTFMGSGSTIAAAESIGYESIGLEIDPDFFAMGTQAIPRLAALDVEWQSFEGPNGDHAGNGHGSVSNAKAAINRRDASSHQPTFW